MTTLSQRTAVRSHRQRLKSRGLARLEVVVPEGDREILRSLAKVLREDPQRAREIRQALRRIGHEGSRPNLKELLAAAPLEGIDLTRPRDLGRDVDL